MAPRRPVLEAYPYLHKLLKSDPQANAQFQACLSSVLDPSKEDPQNAELAASLEKAQTELSKLVAKYQKLLATADKAKRVIRLLGGIAEPQLQFKDYMQDITNKAEYVVKFTPQQIRLFMQLHWDLISQDTEDIIAGRLSQDGQEDEEDEFR